MPSASSSAALPILRPASPIFKAKIGADKFASMDSRSGVGAKSSIEMLKPSTARIHRAASSGLPLAAAMERVVCRLHPGNGSEVVAIVPT